MTRIFISHAYSDKKLVDQFVDRIIRLGCGVDPDGLFYSSGEDTGVPAGSDLMAFVRNEAQQAALTVAILTPTYQTRPVCVAELGAAWATSTLFPMLVPGMSRDRLEGVLPSLLIKPLSDSAALDELHTAVLDAAGTKVKAETWGRHKAQWLAALPELASALPKPRSLDPDEFDRVVADLRDARAALTALGEEHDELLQQLEAVSKLRPSSEVAAIRLPKEDVARFQAIVQAVEDQIDACPRFVRGAFYYRYMRTGMPWPSAWDDSAVKEAEDAVEQGWLDEQNDALVLNEDFREVRDALQELDRLRTFLEEEANDRFFEWFEAEYGKPVDLTKRAVWQLFFD